MYLIWPEQWTFDHIGQLDHWHVYIYKQPVMSEWTWTPNYQSMFNMMLDMSIASVNLYRYPCFIKISYQSNCIEPYIIIKTNYVGCKMSNMPSHWPKGCHINMKGRNKDWRPYNPTPNPISARVGLMICLYKIKNL